MEVVVIQPVRSIPSIIVDSTLLHSGVHCPFLLVEALKSLLALRILILNRLQVFDGAQNLLVLELLTDAIELWLTVLTLLFDEFFLFLETLKLLFKILKLLHQVLKVRLNVHHIANLGPIQLIDLLDVLNKDPTARVHR